MSAVGILFKKEITDSLRDRRTLLMMLFLPVVLYPGSLALIGAVTASGQARLARSQLSIAVTSEDAAQLLTPTPAKTTLVRLDRGAAETALRERKVAAALDVAPGSLGKLEAKDQLLATLLFTRKYDRSIQAKERLKKALEAAGVRALEKRLEQASLPAKFAQPVDVQEEDVDFKKNLGPLIASKLLPMILVMMLFMGALYPALDVTAGEKERGTLETLLVAPVRPMDVMAAKYLTVATIASITTVMNLVAMGITFHLGLDLTGGESPVRLTLSAGQIATLLACLIPAAFMVSGVSLAVASLARSYKEGQSLMTPLVSVALVPAILAMTPGVEFDSATAMLPLLNVALLVKATMLGTATAAPIAITIGSVLACSAAAVALAANAFQSEALRFGGAESWRDLFRFKGGR
ncbi:MAG TPA: ABC transporter permease [Myxococcales bacterium]|jgi:sodium transport system permease protein